MGQRVTGLERDDREAGSGAFKVTGQELQFILFVFYDLRDCSSGTTVKEI